MNTIGKLANELNINVETIRYYERQGLIEQPVKPKTGYRDYTDAHKKQLTFIINAKALGFTLNEIQSLLLLSNDCVKVRSLGLKKLAVIRHKIKRLQKLEKVIVELTNYCELNEAVKPCPIIDALSD